MLQRPRHEDCEFEPSLADIARPVSNHNSNNHNKIKPELWIKKYMSLFCQACLASNLVLELLSVAETDCFPLGRATGLALGSAM